MRTTHRILSSAVAVSLVLVISACGSSSGSDGSKDATTTTKAKAEVTTTTAADSSDDAQARADSVDWKLADFPDGWTSTPPTDGDSKSPVADCDPALGDESVQLAKHATDDYSIGSIDNGDGVQVTARTVVFSDADAAKAAVAPFSEPDVITCIDETLKQAYTSGGNDVTVDGTLGPEAASSDAEETTGLSAAYTVSAGDGSTLDVKMGILVVRTGDVVTNIVIQAVDPNFDPSTLPVNQLVDALNAA